MNVPEYSIRAAVNLPEMLDGGRMLVSVVEVRCVIAQEKG
jgi:hypothetical protein